MINLQRILDLIRKTGDKYIFEDENNGMFVVMSLPDYENYIFKNNQLKDLSEEELLNKINKDIAIWKATQEDKTLAENWHDLPLEEKKSSEDDQYYFEPVEDEE
ncbi:MAG: hypothetical protein NTZ49_05075 [Candidatus Parcubacteria bacterium]|nr:hypothetical protein [Candidatus Parcubacteria bacterium]